MALSKGFVTTAATTALDGRLLEQGLVVKNVGDVPRAGLLYGDVAPVKSTSSMNVSIADQAVFALSRGNTDGVNIVSNVGLATVALASAPSSNSRYDVIYIKHNDTEKGDANSTPLFDKVTGTAAASPAIPATPTGAMAIATVLVPAGVTATNASGVVITNTVAGTALMGSPIRYRSVTEMTSDAAVAVEGSLAYIKGGGDYYLRNGVWRRVDATPYVRVVQPTGTSISSGTVPQTLGGSGPTWETSDTQLFDQGTVGTIGPAKVSGWYDVTAQVTWASSQTGERYIEVTVNDASQTPTVADRKPAATTNVGSQSSTAFAGQTHQALTGQLYLTAGDYVKLKGWQNSGAAINYQSRIMLKPFAV